MRKNVLNKLLGQALLAGALLALAGGPVYAAPVDVGTEAAFDLEVGGTLDPTINLTGDIGFSAAHDSTVNAATSALTFTTQTSAPYTLTGFGTQSDGGTQPGRWLTHTAAGPQTTNFNNLGALTIADFGLQGSAIASAQARGGAIYAPDALTFNNSGVVNFNNNMVVGGSASAGADTSLSARGGAVYSHAGELNLNNALIILLTTRPKAALPTGRAAPPAAAAMAGPFSALSPT